MNRNLVTSSLLLAIACGYAPEASAAQSNDPTTGRAVRQEEGRQKGVASQTNGTVKDLSNLVDEYQFNGVGDQAQVASLTKLQQALGRLTDTTAAAQAQNMPWVVTRLAAVRELQNLAEIRKELLVASTGQDAIVKHLTELMKQMQNQFGAVGIKSDLKEIAQEQAKLKATTEKIADQTLGKKAENLTPEQKADLEKTAQQQNALEQQLEQATDSLKQQAEELKKTDPQQAKAVDEAIKELEKAAVKDKMQAAADNVADNKTAQAQEQQQQALDALNKAQEKLNQAAEENPIAKLEEQLAQVADLAKQEQDLLDKTNALDQNSAQQDFNQLQKDQADLQGQMADLQKEMKTPAQQAQQKALDAQNKAEQAQQQAQQQPTAENKAAAQEAQQAADQAQDAATEAGKSESQAAQDAQAAAEKAQDAADKALAEGNADAAQKAQDAAEAAQEQALAALGQPAGEQAQQAMQQAQADLGQMAQKPAAGDMQKALDALNQMQASMEQQLAQMTGQPKPGPPGPPSQQKPLQVVQDRNMEKDPKESDKLGANLKYGEQKAAGGVNAWQVGLPPQEREALTSAQKDKFPARYEQQLTLYYQNLAAGTK